MFPSEISEIKGGNVTVINPELWDKSPEIIVVVDLATHNDRLPGAPFDHVVVASMSEVENSVKEGKLPGAVHRQGEGEGPKNLLLNPQLIEDLMSEDCMTAYGLIQDLLGCPRTEDKTSRIGLVTKRKVDNLLGIMAKEMRREIPEKTPEFNARMDELIASYEQKQILLDQSNGKLKDATLLFPRSVTPAVASGVLNKPTAKLYFAFHSEAIDEKTTQDFFTRLFEKSSNLQKLELTLISCHSAKQAKRFSEFLTPLASSLGKKLEITVRGYEGVLIPVSMLSKAPDPIYKTPEGFVSADVSPWELTEMKYSQTSSFSYGNQGTSTAQTMYEVEERVLLPAEQATRKFLTVSDPVQPVLVANEPPVGKPTSKFQLQPQPTPMQIGSLPPPSPIKGVTTVLGGTHFISSGRSVKFTYQSPLVDPQAINRRG